MQALALEWSSASRRRRALESAPLPYPTTHPHPTTRTTLQRPPGGRLLRDPGQRRRRAAALRRDLPAAGHGAWRARGGALRSGLNPSGLAPLAHCPHPEERKKERSTPVSRRALRGHSVNEDHRALIPPVLVTPDPSCEGALPRSHPRARQLFHAATAATRTSGTPLRTPPASPSSPQSTQSIQSIN